MKLFACFVIVTLISLSTYSQAGGDKFVYADFEKLENGRPVSNGDGLVQVYTAQESTPVQFKGLANANPGAPELVVPKDNLKNWSKPMGTGDPRDSRASDERWEAGSR